MIFNVFQIVTIPMIHKLVLYPKLIEVQKDDALIHVWEAVIKVLTGFIVPVLYIITILK